MELMEVCFILTIYAGLSLIPTFGERCLNILL